MAPRRFPRLLNTEGQSLLQAAFDDRARLKGAHLDIAYGYLRALKDHGILELYLIEDLDPFDVLKVEAAITDRR